MSSNEFPPPSTKFFADFSVELGKPIEVGHTNRGNRRIIPVLGGTIKGDGWTGRVLPGGADYQVVLTPTMAELEARYVFETDGGDHVYVRNNCVRAGDAQAMARLIRGEANPGEIYFRCCPIYETSAKSLQWVNERMFIGSGTRLQDKMVLRVWELN